MSPENFDQAIRSKLAHWTAPVPADLWQNMRFDQSFQEKLAAQSAPVPEGLWDKITPRLAPTTDQIWRDKLYHSVFPVREEVWENIQEKEEKKRRVAFWWNRYAGVAAALLLFLAGALVAAHYWGERSEETSSTTAPAPMAVPPPDPKKGQSPAELSTLPVDSATDQTAAPKENLGSSPAGSLFLPQGLSLSQKQSGSTAKNNLTGELPKNKLLLTPDSVNAVGDASLDQIADTRMRPQSDWIMGWSENKQWQPAQLMAVKDLDHANKIKNVVICPTDRKNRNTDWDLEVFAGPGMGIKNVSGNGASAAFLQRKDSAESGRVGYTAGFRLVKPISDRLAIKTGLSYTQNNEKFVYRTEDQIRTITVVTVRTIIRGPGDTLRVNDTSVVQQAGFVNNTVKNRFRSIDIPLLAAYRWGNDDFSVGVQAGVVLNLRSWYEGVIMDSSLAPVAVSKEGGMVYKNKIGLGLMAGVQISKKIGYNTHVFAEPFLRYNFNNMTQPEANYQQKIHFGGLAVGLRFNLNNR